MRHFLRDDDISRQEQTAIIDLALALKKNPHAYTPLRSSEMVAVLLDKNSSRTRFSFSRGVADLGGYAEIVDTQKMPLGVDESIADTARVLSRFARAVVWRTYAQSHLEEFAAHAQVPVINGLSDSFHPCQVLADLMTMYENLGSLEGKTVAYVGDGANNMAQSLLLGTALAGMNITVGVPDSLRPAPEVVCAAQQLGSGTVSVVSDPVRAVENADVVITDTWVSMNIPREQIAQRRAVLLPYQVNQKLVDAAAPGAIILHCLPAHRGDEITDEVMDSSASKVFDEAENRLHAQKALLVWLFRQNGDAVGGHL